MTIFCQIVTHFVHFHPEGTRLGPKTINIFERPYIQHSGKHKIFLLYGVKIFHGIQITDKHFVALHIHFVHTGKITTMNYRNRFSQQKRILPICREPVFDYYHHIGSESIVTSEA